MPKLDLDLKSSALLAMDCQMSIVDSLAPPEKAKVLVNLPRAIAAARKAGMPVIYVVVQFREGYPEVSGNNPLFSSVRQAGRLRESDPNSRICDEVRPQPGEVIVTKKRIGAFTGSDLEVVLRSKGIDTLVLTGVSSLGVVESTARHAFDMDYKLFVIGDCCSDCDPKANEVAMSVLLPRLATVCSTDDFVAEVSR